MVIMGYNFNRLCTIRQHVIIIDTYMADNSLSVLNPLDGGLSQISTLKTVHALANHK